MSEINLTDDDKALIRAYLVAIYKNQAQNWTINDKRMDFVPRSHNLTRVGLTYIRKQLLQIAKRTMTRHIYEIEKQYIMCSNVIKLIYNSPLAMARSGL